MRNSLIILLVTAATTSTAAPQNWGASGQWEILIDPEGAAGCYAQQVMEDETEVRFGALPKRRGGFFAANNKQWTQIEDGTTGVVEFDFGDSRFAGEGTGRTIEGVPGGYVFFDNPAFVEEFRKRNSVTVKVDGVAFLEVSLKGTAKAVEAVLKCQSEQPEPQVEE